MAIKPKIYLGLTLIFASLALLIFFSFKITGQNSTASISSSGNGFNLRFNILKKDENKLAGFLSSLSLPAGISKGVTFELDSTSQAKLAQFIPVTADLKFTKNEISFNGPVNHGFLLPAEAVGKLKLPKTTNLAVAAQNLDNLQINKLNFPQKLNDYINGNQQNGTFQYFFNFDNNQNVFAFISKNPPEDLKSLEGDDLTFKEDNQQDFKFILLTYPGSTDNKDQSLFILNFENLTLISASVDTLRSAVDSLKSSSGTLDFPQNSKGKISYALYAKNNDDKFSDTLGTYLFDAKSETLNFTKKLDSFYFLLSLEQFSGLIKVK